MHTVKDFIIKVKRVLEVVPDSVLIVNTEGNCIYFNDNFLKSSGFKENKKSNFHLDKLLGAKGKSTLIHELTINKFYNKALLFNLPKNKEKTTIIAFNIWDEMKIAGHLIVIPKNNIVSENIFEDYLQKSVLTAMNLRNDSVIYITDVLTGQNLFTSNSVKSILGWDPDHFNLGGWLFFFSIIHPNDIQPLFAKHGEWLTMKNKLGPLYDHVENHTYFRLKNFNGEFIPLVADSNVLERGVDGKIKLILGLYRPIELGEMHQQSFNNKSPHVKVIDNKIFVELDYIKKLREQKVEKKENKKFDLLTSRETEILELIVKAFSSQEISEKLNISIHTVNLHRKQMMKKLDAKNLAGLIRIYYTSL